MWQSVVIFSAVFAAISGFSITGPGITQCEHNPGPLPLAANVAGCEAAPCPLPQRQYVVINVVFRPPHDISNMTTRATAYVTIFPELPPLPIHYDLAERSVTCNYLWDTSCPVREGDILQYMLRIYIESDFPTGNLRIELRILDDNFEAVTCLRVSAVIQPPRTQTVIFIN